MRKQIAIAIFIMALGTSTAQAQGTSTTSRTVSPAASSKATGNAPVGHRQPTQADVGNNSGADAVKSAEDRELDRKIKNICKGC